MSQKLGPKEVKLGEKGTLTVPREMLRRLDLADKEATLFLFLKGNRITILTEEEVQGPFADLLD